MVNPMEVLLRRALVRLRYVGMWLSVYGELFRQLFILAYFLMIFCIAWLLIFVLAIFYPPIIYAGAEVWRDAWGIVGIFGRAWDRRKESRLDSKPTK